MAFCFLGTLSTEQLQELRSFLEAQVVDLVDEINYLYVEMNSLRQTLLSFSEADSHFGGTSIELLYKTELHNVVGSPKQNDSYPADLMAKVKKPFIPTIKYKLERNEHKMKKLFDAMEQAKESIDRKSAAKGQTSELLNNIERLFISENSRFLFKTTEDMENFSQGIIPTSKKEVKKVE